MRLRRSTSDRVFDLFVLVFTVLILFSVIYPLYFIAIASFSDPRYVGSGQVYLLPKMVSFAGYGEVFKDQRIWIGYRNTIIYSVLGTLINLFVTVPAGYALSRSDFKARKALSVFFIIPMFVNGGLIPTYIIIKNVGLIDSGWVMMLPFCLSVYNMIIVRTFYANGAIHELLEAARLDGCNNNQFFFRIALPLSKAVVSVVMLYYFVGHWNDYYNGMIYLNSASKQPLQLVLRDILVRNQAFADGITGGDGAQQKADQIKYAVIIVSSLPVLVLYPFLQKYFEKGVMIGSLKG